MPGEHCQIPSLPSSDDYKCCDFDLCWRNVNYSVGNSFPTRLLQKLQGLPSLPKVQSILRNSNGIAKSARLTAFMGPSGCGKSSLLECIVGNKVKGKTGEVLLSGENIGREDISTSFVAQTNILHKQLTVRETILFATKVQLATKLKVANLDPIHCEDDRLVLTPIGGKNYCSVITEKTINELGLEVCADNRVSGCSGGQLKRLAIAQVLVAKPRLLVLDEPTTGLDSVSSLQVVNILRNLTHQKPSVAVLATIHQPSQKVLNLFDKLYLFDDNGNFIYGSNPDDISKNLHKVAIKCSPHYNPVDVLMEIACGDHGDEKREQLRGFQNEQINEEFRNQTCQSIPLNHLEHRVSFPGLSHSWYVAKRNILITIRDPVVFGIRFLSTSGAVLYFIDLFGTKIGAKGGCPPKFDANFEPEKLDEIGDETELELNTVYNNTGNLIISILFVVFSALLPSCVSFPNEMLVFKAEYKNKWYGIWSFFAGVLISEVPFHLLMTTIHIPTMFYFQNQPPELWRMLSAYYIILLLQLNAQTMGYITGALFMYNVPAAVFLGPNFWFIPFMLLCGTFIKMQSLSPFFYYLSHLSIFRFGLEGILVSVYGFDRCGTSASRKLIEGKEAFVVWMSVMLGIYGDGTEPDSKSNVTESTPTELFVVEMIEMIAGDFTSKTNEVRSSVMNVYDLEDWFLFRSIFWLLVILIGLRLLALICITLRVKSE